MNTSSITAIKRGAFAVPILFPQQQSSKCLARTNESRAWQCAFDIMLQLSILPSLGDDEQAIMVTLGLPSSSNRSIHCGQQAPEIEPTALTAVNSTDDGPHFHFSALYDRTVILREDQLGQERINISPAQGELKHTNFPPGQSLWRCTFNDTLLEGFLYADKQGDEVSNTTDAVSGANSHLPYKLELVEHRVASEDAPYCERVVVGVGGGLEESGERVDLLSSEARSGPGQSQDNADASCQCQWAVG